MHWKHHSGPCDPVRSVFISASPGQCAGDPAANGLQVPEQVQGQQRDVSGRIPYSRLMREVRGLEREVSALPRVVSTQPHTFSVYRTVVDIRALKRSARERLHRGHVSVECVHSHREPL